MKRTVCIISLCLAGLSIFYGGVAHSGATSFQDRDTNLDGRISLAEFSAHHMEKFKEMDLDRDGFLTIKDLEKSRGKVVAGVAVFLADTLFRKQARKYRDMDANRDERITPEEFLNSKKTQFVEMDLNGDHFISSDEFGKFKKKKPAG